VARPQAVGIRELRQNLSVYLRRVGCGETFHVTDRGQPVASLGPIEPPEGLLERLIAQGDAVAATRRLADLLPPEPPDAKLVMSGSEALALLRSDER
jgi:prevent-host-death family protein